MNIVVFDSGLGGLSVLREIRELLPSLEAHYVSDNEAFPYGPRSEEDLTERVVSVIDRVVEELDPALLVIACNTASTVVLPILRERLDIPVVGVIPAIKPAAALSQSKVIGLLATPGTVARSYTKDLIDEFASDCEVIMIGTSELVEMAEGKLMGKEIDPKNLATILEPFSATKDLDAIVLGCTHFPLVETELRDTLPGAIEWIQSGPAIARRVRTLLPESDRKIGKNRKNRKGRAYFTAGPPDSKALGQALRDHGLEERMLLP